MRTVIDQVERLSVELFAAIPSQTSEADRRSLLGVQRATARRHGAFAYLEIGSHLGGSIQPYLLDPRCTAIYSIDSRPTEQPDDRVSGYVARYPGNSTARMLGLLREVDPGQVSKLRCFDADASGVDPAQIEPRPNVAFIDGEHTRKAVLSDFAFCRSVLAEGGTIVFDDLPIVYAAVVEICRSLRHSGAEAVMTRLEGKIFAIFFDEAMVRDDPFLRRCRGKHRCELARYRWKLWAKGLLPGPAGQSARAIRRESGEGSGSRLS